MSRAGAWIGAAATSLGANPLRTLLSTLGVVVGVAALVAILALSTGLERFGREQVGGTTDIQVIALTPQPLRSVDGVLVPRRNAVRFDAIDLATVREMLGDSADVALDLAASAWLGGDGADSARVALVHAMTPGAAAFLREPLEAGRFLDDADVARDRRVTVVTADFARRLGGADASGALGRTLRLDSLDYEIVGVTPAGAAAADTTAPPRLLVPLSPAAGRRLASADPRRVATLLVRARRFEETEAVQDRLEAWLATRTDDPGAVAVSSYRQRAAQARRVFFVFKLVMGSIAGISLLVGGIGIMNILLASVSERTREIGVRKAIGARRRDILLQFLAESVAISGAGSVLGIVLGLAGAELVAVAIRGVSGVPLSPGYAWSSVLVAAGAALLIGLVFGTYPARRAARLSPVDAIRHE